MENTEFKELKKQLLSTKKNGYDRPLDQAAMEERQRVRKSGET